MNKNKKRMGEKTKNMNRDERREGDEGAAQKKTTSKAKKRKKVWHRATDWNIRGQEEATHNGAPWTGTSGGTQWQADKHTDPGLEHPGKKEKASTRATKTGASGGQKPRDGTKHPEKKRVALERSVRGCRRGKRRPRQGKREASQGEHEQEQGTEGRERTDRSRGKRTVMGEEKGTKERHRRRQPAKQEGEGRQARCHGLGHTGQI